jgi:hypothetical protein
MSLTLTDYITAAKQNKRKHTAKIVVMDNNENVLDDISKYLISGNVTLNNQMGSRRSATLLLSNNTDKFTPGYRNTLWLSTKLKIWTGLTINGEDYLISRGIFVISEVQLESNGSEKQATLTLLDKNCFLTGEIAGALPSPYIIPVGTDILSAVSAIFTAAGEVQNPILGSTAELTPYSINADAGESYSSILESLANMISYTYYFDKNGTPRFVPPTDESTEPSVWDYAVDEATYLGVNHRYEFNTVKNSVYVIGDNINSDLVTANAQDSYFFSTTKVSDIGERVKVINDTLIYSDSLAYQRAVYELKKSIILQESIDMQTIPVDIIKEDSVITAYDTLAGLNRDRYLVNAINYPLLSDGNMTVNAWKIRPITDISNPTNPEVLKSLLHFNGADASTTFTDVTGLVWTRHGGAQLDTAYKKYGSASGLFDGSGDYISATYSDELSNRDFCIDFWHRMNNNQNAKLFAIGSNFYISTDIYYSYNFQYVFHAHIGGHGLYIYSPRVNYDNDFHHVALYRNGNNIYLNYDGIDCSPLYISTDTVATYTGTMAIAASIAGADEYHGHIDEFRFALDTYAFDSSGEY